MSRLIIKLLTVVVLCLAIFIGYLSITYIDRTITEGEGYGFEVGDSKKHTYFRANNNYKKTDVFILYPTDKDGFGPHYRFKFENSEYTFLSDLSRWEIYFDKGYRDFIRLDFQNNMLVSIYRHRQKFELP